MSYATKQYNLSDREEYISLITKLYKEYPFSDIFSIDKPTRIETHTHSDDECRLFLKGTAKFIIDGDEIICSSGTFINIEANTLHSFIYEETTELKVMRFFKNNRMWEANYE